MDFELLGKVGDETRLLRERQTGYSVPLPGGPSLATPSSDSPRYDVLVTHAEVNVEYGFRIDEVPTAAEPESLAEALVLAYGRSRAREGTNVVAMGIGESLRPRSATGGAEAIYPLRESGETTMEHLWVALRPGPNGMLALHRTTRFRPSEIFIVKWHHVRTAFSSHHQWDPSTVRDTAPAIWPHSKITQPKADLDLTDAGWKEAEAKARDVGDIDRSTTAALGELLIQVAEVDLPPAAALPTFLLDHHARTFAPHGEVGRVLTRNLSECATAFDLRGWVWQCVWAIGNRAALRVS